MGHRLSKIYTRTGDQGETGLGDGSRIGKDHLRIEAIGSVDELNSVIGILLTHSLPDIIHAPLVKVQHKLFDLGGELCIPGHEMIRPADIEHLETHLDTLNAELPLLKDFILPGGSKSAACCHFARTVCRRAERQVVSLARTETVGAVSLRYLNRLSDLLFVMARALNHIEGHEEILWQRD